MGFQFQAIEFLRSLFAEDGADPAPALRSEAPGQAQASSEASGQASEAQAPSRADPQEDLLAVSEVTCSWPDCQYPATVLIKTKEALPSKAVCPCGSTSWLDAPIHNGRTIRRNCARCGRFLGFPVWYGKPEETLPTPTQEDIQHILAKAEALGWPYARLNPWTSLGPGEDAWRKFTRYLSVKQPTSSADRTRLRSYREALEALQAIEHTTEKSCTLWP